MADPPPVHTEPDEFVFDARAATGSSATSSATSAISIQGGRVPRCGHPAQTVPRTRHSWRVAERAARAPRGALVSCPLPGTPRPYATPQFPKDFVPTVDRGVHASVPDSFDCSKLRFRSRAVPPLRWAGYGRPERWPVVRVALGLVTFQLTRRRSRRHRHCRRS